MSHAWGTTLRGGFGSALRELTCAMPGRACRECSLNSVCPYGYLFETPIDGRSAVMRKYTNAPHPFVFEPPIGTRRSVKEGELATLAFVLVGQAAEYLPHFLLTLSELGRRGLGMHRVPYTVMRFEDETGRVIYDRHEGERLLPPEPVALRVAPGRSERRRFALRFLSPVRLTVRGKLARRITLYDIAAALRRRLFLLSAFHQRGAPIEADEIFLDAARNVRLVREDMRWIDDRRLSTRQKREIPIGGLAGSLVFEGDYGLLKPLLAAGEYVHVGKNAVFGLGRYEIVTEEKKNG